MTDEARTATNQLSRLVHLPCTSTTSIRPINADAIRTEIIIANSVVGRHRCTNPQMGGGRSRRLLSENEPPGRWLIKLSLFTLRWGEKCAWSLLLPHHLHADVP